MHSSRSRDGGLLYPAMPFASYTKVTRADSDAIFEFTEANLGSELRPDATVLVRAIGQQYSFTPPCILVVPADTPVRLRMTSADAPPGSRAAQPS